MPHARSQLMAKVRSKGNVSTERAVARELKRRRIRGWRRHVLVRSCRPDFYFPRERVAVFVDGCFWHGCKRCARTPKTRVAFWRRKFVGNRRRDARNDRRLRASGVSALHIWEHELIDHSWQRRLARALDRAESL